MKKELWVQIDKPDKSLVTACIEAGADALLIPQAGQTDAIRKLGKIKIVAPDGDLKLGVDAVIVKIHNKEDERRAAREAASKTVVVDTTDWTIIPLENLVAQSDALYTYVSGAEEARLAAGILEKGVKGVVLRNGSAKSVRAVADALRDLEESLTLVPIKLTKVVQTGMGDRVCVDTCTKMSMGEGILVGNSSSGFFLVHAEVEESEYVASRPFRVNAGALHAYCKVPDGKTKYLSEIQAGVEVLLVRHNGKTQRAVVGRAKIERRPMLLIEGISPDARPVSLVLQNAETIKLTLESGIPKSVVDLIPGDSVLGLTDDPGRHFGMKVKESIQEK
ncbi:3-dehydroquinate synthase II [bacterium]|nr:3-dehydroquinate synthase II [bacterium]